MFKIAVLVSGGGTNLKAIMGKIKDGYLKNVSISLVVSSKKGAYALKRADDNGIEAIELIRSEFDCSKRYDEALISLLDERDIELIVLAGFTVIFGSAVIEKYKNRIINVHPALIPSFCGKGFYGIIPHRAALEYGVKVSGATVHFVDAGTDTGPIILQKAVNIDDVDDEYVLQKKIMQECEWELLPEAIKLISQDRITIDGRKVIIKKESKDK